MKLHAVTIDTSNPQALAAWWSKALGIEVANDYGAVVQLGPSPALPLFQFQQVNDVPRERNRVHVDLKTSDIDSETARLVKLGATVVQKFDLPQIRYTTLTDLDGNKFDLVQE